MLQSVIFGMQMCIYRPERNAKGDPIELNFEGLEMQK